MFVLVLLNAVVTIMCVQYIMISIKFAVPGFYILLYQLVYICHYTYAIMYAQM